MIDRRLLDDYFDWMLSEVDFYSPKHRDYELLVKDLNKIKFKWVLPMDENREMDGRYLRKEFLFDCGYSIHNLWDDPVSVLEVLVAFSRRIEIEITGEPGNDDLGRWFWIMLDNLGLLKFNDRNYERNIVNKIIEIWLDRKFKTDGKGSIFLTRRTDIDMKNVEMWYQMHHYLNENWSF